MTKYLFHIKPIKYTFAPILTLFIVSIAFSMYPYRISFYSGHSHIFQFINSLPRENNYSNTFYILSLQYKINLFFSIHTFTLTIYHFKHFLFSIYNFFSIIELFYLFYIYFLQYGYILFLFSCTLSIWPLFISEEISVIATTNSYRNPWKNQHLLLH